MSNRPGDSASTASEPTRARRQPAFAHASEAEMARILDFYDVRWEYEPHTFPILWNLDGDVVESFAPDFWLPDLGLYLEMTTLKQRLVRRKNRKLRRVLDLYPDLRVKLFYARDFRALMLKYGKLALAAGLSGSLGQVPPVRAGSTRLAAPVVISTDEAAARPEGEPARATAGGSTAVRGADAAAGDTAAGPAAAGPAAAAFAAGNRAAERRTARRRRARRRSATHAASLTASAEGGA